ncbi:hypothetical protein DN069_29435 [Streptacidiphilus pinicola]|uniref:Uncharacterized protein n=1 Tax=Streptacidiphilus pinicola TaxID=2219663 RepID=A0A2X0IEN6_9ACTN|nr:ricin-type beta-trefoil lectin domain protein [Streptacidiphilus pinicola]RAG82083.1 hypothetical protein DN069_29435 [Streptacidiphilus pinicola]
MTTDTTNVVANPDGSLTQTTNALPVQIQQNGTWVPLDDTLTQNADGTISPKATPTNVVLSGGGSGPLVTLTDPAGHSLAMSMPFTLPTPTLSGNTAAYSSVLPGVDLSVSVDEQGTFRDVLIVHDAAAAANPALKTLQLAASGQGLNLASDTGGGMVAEAADGTAVFSSPAPVMWDSSTGSSGTITAHAAATLADAGGASTSSVDGPGSGAQVDPVALAASGNALTLTPDQNLLTGNGVSFPVFIDPAVVDDTTKYYDQVWEGCPDADTGWNTEEGNGTSAGEGIGYIQPAWGGTCGSGYEESFYVMDLSKIPHGASVSKANVNLTQTYGAYGGCDKKWPVTLRVTDGINSPTSSNPTTWNHRPYAATGVMAFSQTNLMYSVDATTSCGGGNTTTFDLASQVNAAQGGTITFGLYGEENTDATNFGHMRFARNPYIQTTYDLKPNIDPSTVDTSPKAVTVDASGNLVSASPACGSGTPGWIGLTSTNYGASSIDLQSTATSPITGTDLAIWYTMVDNKLNDGTGNPKQVTSGNVPYAVSPRVGSYPIGTTVQDGHQYTWQTHASDGTLPSNTVSGCTFDVDLTPPAQATIASSDFPASGSGTAPAKDAGQAGSFTVTATDPAPDASTCTLGTCLPASGIAGFRYSLDQPIPTLGFTYQAASSGQATLNITPGMWGSHILYVEAVDNAGNVQTVPSTYSFYAPWNPTTKVTAGDLTGDGVPDMLATDNNGNLILLPGNTDPSTTAATIAGTPSTSPDGTSWKNFDIAHRGSLQNGGVDDLFAYSTKTSAMYRYTNDGENGGTYGHFSKTSGVSPITHPTCTATGRCTGYNTDWSGIRQMIAPGDLQGDTSYATANLITKELDGSGHQELWLYQTTASTPLSNPVLLGTGDWSQFDLIAPGVVGGNLATKTPGTPMLWVRATSTGMIYSLPLKDSSGSITTLTPPVTTTLQTSLTDSSGRKLCIDDNALGTADGNRIQVWFCDSTVAQYWTYSPDQSLRVLGKCLDATSTPTSGTKLQLWTCNGTAAQHWLSGANGSLTLASQPGLCVDDPGSSTTDGTQLQLYGCDNTSAQNWTSAAVSGWTTNPSTDLSPILPAAAYPAVASPGDMTGLGQPDLYAASAGGDIIDYQGLAPTGTNANFAAPFVQGSYSTATHWWILSDGGSNTTAADNAPGGTPATLNGGTTWTTDSKRGTVLTFDGKTGYTQVGTTPVIDTTQSFSISAWIDLTDTSLAQQFLGEGTNYHQAFTLGYNPSGGGFMFQATGANTATTPWYTAAANAPAQTGWHHLVGVYDATARTMTLYVDGSLAGQATNAAITPAIGPLTMGAVTFAGGTVSLYSQSNGSLSDMHVYPTALSPSAATSISDNPPQINQLN